WPPPDLVGEGVGGLEQVDQISTARRDRALSRRLGGPQEAVHSAAGSRAKCIHRVAAVERVIKKKFHVLTPVGSVLLCIDQLCRTPPEYVARPPQHMILGR